MEKAKSHTTQVPSGFKIKLVVDLDNTCRVCFASSDVQALTNKWNNLPLIEMLNNFMPVRYDLRSIYPPNICSKCTTQLITAYVFMNNCRAASDIFEHALMMSKKESGITSTPNKLDPNVIYDVEDDSDDIDSIGIDSDDDKDDEEIASSGDEEKADPTDNEEAEAEASTLIEDEEHQANDVDENLATQEDVAQVLAVTATSLNIQAQPKRNRRHVENLECSPPNPKKRNLHRVMCDICGKLVNGLKNLERHTSFHTSQDTEFVCELCGCKLKTSHNLYQHKLRLHTEQPRKHRCAVCAKLFFSRYQLTLHVRSHTKEKPFACEACGSCFQTSGNLKRHRLLHTGERRFKCEICGKGFFQKCTMQEHMAVHDKDRHRKCPHCKQIFENWADVKTHVSLEHGAEPVPSRLNTRGSNRVKRPLPKIVGCSECDRRFHCKAALELHMTVHTGEKKYRCGVCDRAFRLPMTMRIHMRTHTDERPFNCPQCDKRFRQAGHLKYHLSSMHDGPLNYPCGICGRAFALKVNLTVHLRKHTGEKPFACDVCDKRYVDVSSRNKHVKIQHGSKKLA